MFRSSNPALNANAFSVPREASGGAMTLDGTVFRSGLLIVLLIASGSLSWSWVQTHPEHATAIVAGGIIGGLVLAFVTILFAKKASPVTAPMYAIVKGAALGAISLMFESAYSGIVMNAIIATVGVFLTVLVLYATRVVRVTDKLRTGIIAATMGIMLVYLVSFVMGLFGAQIPYLHEGGAIGIGISVFIVIVAALNLLLDFDFIEEGSKQGLPKYMEWFAAFGLLITLVWLYLEILRLLSKMRR